MTPNSRKLRAKWLPSVCCVNKPKKKKKKIKQVVPEIHQEGDEIWFEVLTGKALSVSLEFIDETGENFFVYKCRLSLGLLSLPEKVQKEA